MRIAFYKGRDRFFNRFVSFWTVGSYSHVEALFDATPPVQGKTLCGSSSFMDGGVRLKWIALDPAHWDIMEVPTFNGCQMLKWFHDHRDAGYDLVGLLSTSSPIRQQRGKWFCNEAIGAAAGLEEPWRFNPNSFARICELLPGSKWIQGGPPQQQQKSEETRRVRVFSFPQ
ncbi:hypothetical protein [Noviherbaspirillum malthae]|uniref:hypothetical protein n=1 Tax=Noviherbaspirillum malthae TaxID=1260987 RepID=UPI00188DFA84|nr:hypothetical protein [Noviherbaspirillum malthae]